MCWPTHPYPPKLIACLAALAVVSLSALADRAPYTSFYTYDSDLGVSRSIVDARPEDGSFVVFTAGGFAGSGYATAMIAMPITVDHPMRLRVTYTIDYIGGCDTLEFGFSGLGTNWRIDGENAGARTLVSPFSWDSVLDKTAALIGLLVTAGTSAGVLPDLPAAIEAFRQFMGEGTAVVDAIASLVETLKAKRETVSFTFDATGTHWIEIGMEAKTGAVGAAVATVMAMGVVSEIRVEPELARVEVQGQPSVGENTSADYTCVAYYSDGTTADVTDRASWSLNTTAARIDRGRLAVGGLSSDVACTVAANYTWKPTDQTRYAQGGSRKVALAKAPSVSSTAPEVVGEYYDPLNGDNVLEINEDGTFYTVAMAYLGLNVGEEGTWRVAGMTLTLSFADGALRGQVEDGALLFEPIPILSLMPSVWIRRGKPGPSTSEVAGEYTPAKRGDGRLLLDADGTYELQQEDPFGDNEQEIGRWSLRDFIVELQPNGSYRSEYSGVYAASSVYLPHGMIGSEMLIWAKDLAGQPASTAPATYVPNEPATSPSEPEEAASACDVLLRDSTGEPITDRVLVGDILQVTVNLEAGEPARVRFASDSSVDGVAPSEWSPWYSWGTSQGEWDTTAKTMSWTFQRPGTYELWVEVEDNGITSRCSRRLEAVAYFWAEVAHVAAGRWSLRQSPGLQPSDTVLKRVPNSWVVRVTNTHGGQTDKDGYIWWEVEDTTEGLVGWMAASDASGPTRYLLGSLQDDSGQQALAERADPVFADTRQERVEIITKAVEHYFADSSSPPSLYSSNDKARDGSSNDLSLLRTEGFPIDVVFAIIAQETGGVAYKNSGDGAMQIDWGPSKGLASNIECPSAGARYYANTRQSIYANIKDGLKTLRDNFARARGKEVRLATAVLKYNTGGAPKTTYCACQGDPFYLAHVGIRLDGNEQCDGGSACTGQQFKCLDCGSRGCGTRCEVNADPTIEEFGRSLQPELAAQLKRCQMNHVLAFTCSPADVRLRDSEGRVTGVVDGLVVEEVPGSVYMDGVVVCFSPDSSLVYETVGQSQGAYGLVLERVTAGKQVTIIATEMSTTMGATHRYSVDWDAVAAGRDGVAVAIDDNGDGTYETSVTTGSELDGSSLGATSSQSSTRTASPLQTYYIPAVAGIGAALVALAAFVLGRRSARRGRRPRG